MKLPSMESVVIPMAQFTKVGIYWTHMNYYIFDMNRRLQPGDAYSLLIWFFLMPMYLEFLSGFFSLVQSKGSWYFVIIPYNINMFCC